MRQPLTSRRNKYIISDLPTLLSDYPDKQLKIYNRGVGGNKVYQLRDRWELDTLAISTSRA